MKTYVLTLLVDVLFFVVNKAYDYNIDSEYILHMSLSKLIDIESDEYTILIDLLTCFMHEQKSLETCLRNALRHCRTNEINVIALKDKI